MSHAPPREAWRRTPWQLAEHISPQVGGQWTAWRYLRFICNVILAEMAARPQGARIVLNAPPRHGKSELISKWLPVWFLELFPKKRVMLGSYGAELASFWGRNVRDIFNGCPDLWTKLRDDTQNANRWETQHGGGMMTAGVGGAFTGFGFHLGIIDDPCKNWQDAHSPTMRTHEQNWFDSTFYTRREPGGHIIVLMQRWHEDDMTGYLLKRHADNWLHITFPALAEEDDALGRPVGAALCPERYDEEALAAIKLAQGPKWWGLYQQRPLPAYGSIIRPSWIKLYDTLPADVSPRALSLDAAFKDGEENSFVVLQAWAKRRADYFLLEQIREHMDYVPTEAAMVGMIKRRPRCRARLVEGKANGAAIISRLRRKFPGVIEINPHESKEARLQACAPLFQAGNVWVPANAPWVNDYIDELTTFPSSAFNDQVDCTSQFLNWDTERMASAGGGFGGIVPH